MRVGTLAIRDVGPWLGLLALAALAGCNANYKAETEQMHRCYESGSLEAAAQESLKANDAAARDKVVYLLEEGAVQRAADHLDVSEKAFDSADSISDAFAQQAKERVSQEALDLTVSPAAVDYRGFAYDRIMMNTYKALDALELGDLDRARVELTRAL